MSEEKFEFKRSFFDNDFNLAFISILGLPFILLKKGSIDLTFGSIIFTIYSFIIYFSFSKVFKIIILDNETELINIFGKKIVISNNKIFFSEEYYRKQTKDSVIHTRKLEIQFPNNKITIYKDDLLNYNELVVYCKEKYIQSDIKKINVQFYFFLASIICSGIFFFILTKNCFEAKNQDNLESIQKIGYVKIEGTFNDYKNIGRSSSQILIHLKEYPEFEFSPNNFLQNQSTYYKKLNTKGEKITFYISPNEYSKKIQKSIPLTFYDKYFEYYKITTYKLE
ncbi:hypothetical protein MKJ01_16885 [Chryseobacterium sp. SSA4.19]|uniref:hypothetical protein n=1 Tax=Chryseobacterium sp. SSA4.19 TaxID=2919915 RepID=UPI001F4E5CE4|nr:hypothetical protein [Chryseobacterium sp. SSA4.19]MCJ8155435.1 hypothetical protein [Chryseobacterium sp. SSA4.19]